MHPIISLVATWQGLIFHRQNIERQAKYEAAQAYAKKVGKPLLVVGGPFGSWETLLKTCRHGYGDVCLDLDPAACAGAPEICVADVRAIPYPDKHFGAAFCSHVLEHMPTVADAEKALSELHRVAEAVYIAVPSKQFLPAVFHVDHFLWLTEKPDGSVMIEQR